MEKQIVGRVFNLQWLKKSVLNLEEQRKIYLEWLKTFLNLHDTYKTLFKLVTFFVIIIVLSMWWKSKNKGVHNFF